MVDILDYELPDEIKDYSDSENIQAFKEWDKSIEEIKKYLEELDIKYIGDIKNKLLNILDSEFELIDYNKNYINDLIRYYFYLKITKERENRFKNEEEDHKYEQNQINSFNILLKIIWKIKNWDEVDKSYSDLIQFLDELNIENFIKFVFDVRGSFSKYIKTEINISFVNENNLKIFKYLFIDFLKKLNNNEKIKNEYFYKLFFLEKNDSNGLKDFLKDFSDLSLFIEYEKYIIWKWINRKWNDFYIYLKKYIFEYLPENKEKEDFKTIGEIFKEHWNLKNFFAWSLFKNFSQVNPNFPDTRKTAN